MSLQSASDIGGPTEIVPAPQHAPSLTEVAYRRLEEAIVTLSMRKF